MLQAIRRPLALLALVGALGAILLSYLTNNKELENHLFKQVQGKNNTVLFLSNSNLGYSNVHLATAFALLEKHPSVKIHYGMFEKLRPRVERVSEYGKRANPAAQPISIHLLHSEEYIVALKTRGVDPESSLITGPGWAGGAFFHRNFRWVLSPWLQEDHLDIYRDCADLINTIDPAVVVLDPILRPAIEATQDADRLYAVLSPNTFETFLKYQPWAKWLWKFPAVTTGYPYPLPWTYIPANIASWARLIYNIVTMDTAEARQFLKSKGIKDPLNFDEHHRVDSPWITQAMREAALPIEYLPPNVSAVGPIVFSAAPAEQQDAELAQWISTAPTVLINLGSMFMYTEERARAMAGGIKLVLDKTDVQVLWKIKKAGVYGDEFREELEGYVDEDRLRIESWLTVDPAALVYEENVVASVHHGGANCYHEALSAGIPHVILPLWADLFDFATYSEYYGIGVWACRPTTPDWTAEGIAEALLKVLDNGEAGVAMRAEARRLGEIARARPGRDAAAQIIADLAGTGK
ncbi:uncharacterized protein DNG_08919 [Cephalotrichum gorgonifer]|uniref:UDPGT domain-containing protein n=1 Tax=Cephalotrichum gorgonifer TaxID=2041049 RepID=A0AAE8N4S4_9PEZI|nr:uncharacterized protein DNG_08919 [Cephalotrichum gorgonifer]